MLRIASGRRLCHALGALLSLALLLTLLPGARWVAAAVSGAAAPTAAPASPPAGQPAGPAGGAAAPAGGAAAPTAPTAPPDFAAASAAVKKLLDQVDPHLAEARPLAALQWSGVEATRDAAGLQRLTAAFEVLRGVRQGLKTDLKSDLKALQPLPKPVTDASDASQKLSDDQKKQYAPQLAAALADKTALDARLQELQAMLGTQTGDSTLQDAVVGFYRYGQVLVDGAEQDLQATGLDVENASAGADELRPRLAKALPAVTSTIGLAQGLRDLKQRASPWMGADEFLAQSDTLSVADKKPRSGFFDHANSLYKDTSAVVQRLPDWLHTVALDAGQAVIELNGAATSVRNLEPSAFQTGGAASGAKFTVGTELNSIELAWPALAEQLGHDAANLASVEKDRGEIGAIRQHYGDLNVAMTILNDLLAGDMGKFVNDQVRLFYFGDVTNLMKVLNSDARVLNPESEQARQAAAQAHTQLVQQDADLSEKLGEVSDAASRVREVQEEIRQASADADQAGSAAQQSSTLLAHLTARRDQATQSLTAKPDDAALKDQVQQLTSEVQAQQSKVDDANAAKSAADQRRQALLQEQNGLPTRQEKAKSDLQTAQEAVRRLRRSSELQASEGVGAFAAARDDAPLWYATPRSDSPDPAHRVFLYAYEDSKIIYLRGLPDDVALVKEIIAQYDRPAPQALITLWTLQLNGSDNRKLNNAMKQVDQDLSRIRSGSNAFQELLRSCINHEIDLVAAAVGQATSKASGGQHEVEGRLARYFFYAPEVCERLGFPRRRTEWEDVERSLSISLDLERAADYLKTARELSSVPRATRGTRQNDQTDRETELAHQQAALLQAASRALHRAIDDQQRLTESAGDRSLGLPTAQAEQNVAQHVKDLLQAEKPQSQAGSRADVGTSEADVKSLGCWAKAACANAVSLLEKSDLKNSDPKAPAGGELLKKAEYLTQWTLPDPTHATTLGEMLFVVSLGSRCSRARIYDEFQVRLHQVLRDGSPAEGQANPQGDWFQQLADAALRRFRGYFGSQSPVQDSGGKSSSPDELQFPGVVFGDVQDEDGVDEDEGLTPNQFEIVQALQTKARADLSAAVQHLIRQIDQLPSEQQYDDGLAHQLRTRYLHLVGWLSADGARQPSGAGEARLSQDTPGQGPDWYEAGLMATTPKRTTNFPTATDVKAMDRAAWEIARVQGELSPLSKGTPRVAAADDMIKRLISAIQTDLDSYFIKRALDDINQNVRSGVELGTIQRTSILATNRLVARVDPNASADIDQEQEQNALEASTQLAQIAQQFQSKNKASGLSAGLVGGVGGAAANAGTLAAAGLGFLPLLGAFANQAPPPLGEIYSINSGNQFQVTPIFDPSGQAIRFRFDFNSNVRVREPDGSVDPQVPRVERHSVNTEVQLSNMELREISRFETNTKLGLPGRRTGGVPFLNQLPVLKEIPLVGYYVRNKKTDGVRQESLILAQTVVYPTVSDIAELLLESAPGIIAPGKQLPALVRTASEIRKPTKLDLAADVVAGGSSVTATVTLDDAAPAGGLDITLLSSDPIVARVPTQLHIPEGQPSGVFTVKTGSVQTFEKVTLQAIAFGTVAHHDLSVNTAAAPQLQAITLAPPAEGPGHPLIGTLLLTTPAPAQGVVVELTADPPAVKMARQVKIEAGATTGAFQVDIGTPPAGTKSVTITAAANGRTITCAVPIPADHSSAAARNGLPASHPARVGAGRLRALAAPASVARRERQAKTARLPRTP